MKNIILISLLLLSATVFAQNVSISATANDLPDNSAMLDVKSTSMGILIPRLTSAQRTGIVNPALGLMIFNTDRKCLEYFAGTEWSSSDPAGTIKPFAGDKLPEGWLWCDGSEVSRTTYADLFLKIDIAWGQGSSSSTFNLPDLRGYFIRGVDNMDNTVGTGGGAAGNDPDILTRTALKTGGNFGNKVGSIQSDQLKSHSHTIDRSSTGDNGGLLGGDAANLLGARFTSNPFGGNETRPKNAYVNYIIKY